MIKLKSTKHLLSYKKMKDGSKVVHRDKFIRQVTLLDMSLPRLTRLGNVFTLGKGTKPWVSLPKGKGIKLTIIEEARKRLSAQQAA
ncbi:hypothetical protein YC2023_049036 [Brassica napus]